MAYTTANLENVYSQIDGVWKIFRYLSTDAIGTVTGTSYITDPLQHRMGLGDLVYVVNQTTPLTYICQVSAYSATTNLATLAVVTTAATGTFTDLTVTGNSAIGDAITDTLAFYGTTKISQRALAAQNTTTVTTASSTAVDTLTKAAIIEIMNTLQALGLWKGAA